MNSVVPLAAVTFTESVFVPATRPVAPVTTNFACESAVATLTATPVVPRGRFTVEPAAVSTPLIDKLLKAVLLDAGTLTVTR